MFHDNEILAPLKMFLFEQINCFPKDDKKFLFIYSFHIFFNIGNSILKVWLIFI